LLLAVSCCQACTRATSTACTTGELKLVSTTRLTAGVDLSNPPFGFTDPSTGAPVGFEVDLVRALAKAMELKITLLDRAAPTLIPAALAHQIDVGAAGFRDDGSLPPDICTSSPYLAADLAVVTTPAGAGEIKGPSELAGRVVGVASASPAARWAAANLHASTVRVFATSDDALSSVRGGQIDAAIVPQPTALRARTVPNLHLVAAISVGAHYVLAGAADTAVMAPVDTALRKLASDGTLDQLKKKWFGPGI
jgi:ABC-type amino acid transport substrate-binding protein